MDTGKAETEVLTTSSSKNCRMTDQSSEGRRCRTACQEVQDEEESQSEESLKRSKIPRSDLAATILMSERAWRYRDIPESHSAAEDDSQRRIPKGSSIKKHKQRKRDPVLQSPVQKEAQKRLGRGKRIEAKKLSAKGAHTIPVEEALQEMTSSHSSLDDSDTDTGEDRRASQCMIYLLMCIDFCTELVLLL